MENKKKYKIKDEKMSRDGLKMFMKNEMCKLESCRF
jgi:hypothetical protein